jgi:sodium transport system permease protein
MNTRDIWTQYTMEIRSALRERSIVVYSIILPIFMYPVMLWVMFTAITFVQGLNEGFTSRIAVLADVPEGHSELIDSLGARRNVELSFDLDEADAVAQVQAGDLDALISFAAARDEGAALPGNFRIDVRYDRSESRSRTAAERIEEAVDDYRATWMSREAEALGVSDADRVLFALDSENVSTSEDLGALFLGIITPLFLTIMVAMGAFYPAVDTTAGERERSTWETSMTTAASRASMVTAKYLYVATMGVAAGVLNVLALFVSIGAVLAPILGGTDDISFRFPLLAVPVMMAGAIGLALMLSAAMMILASFARTFKDGQAMIQPVYIVAILVPLLLGQQSDRTLTAGVAAVPVANVAMMVRDAINGIFVWPYILEALAVNLAMVALCLGVARFVLRFEDFLIGSFDGSFWRFAKDRLRPGRFGKESA